MDPKDLSTIPDEIIQLFREQANPQSVEESGDLNDPFFDGFGDNQSSGGAGSSAADAFFDQLAQQNQQSQGYGYGYGYGYDLFGETKSVPPEEKINKIISRLFKASANVISQSVKGALNTSKEEWGKYFTNLYKVSWVLLILCGILYYFEIEKVIFPIGDIVIGLLILIAISYIAMRKLGVYNELEDVEETGEQLAEMFGVGDSEEDEELVEDDEELVVEDEEFEEEEYEEENLEEQINDVLSTVPDNMPVTARSQLFNISRHLFPTNIPNFADKTEVPRGSDEWIYFSYYFSLMFQQEFSKNVNPLESIAKIYKTYSGYDILVPKVPGVTLKRLDSANNAGSIAAYFKSTPDEVITVNISEIQGYYVFRITSNQAPVITVGDMMKKREVEEFLLDDKNKLPWIVGLEGGGKVKCIDLSKHPHALIVGTTGGGKSWFIAQGLATLFSLCTPQEVSLIILDSKKSAMLKRFNNFPHTIINCGDVRQFTTILDTVYQEGEYRAQLLSEYDCEDIDQFRKQHPEIPMPYIIIFIDEVNAVKEEMSDSAHEEFMSRLKIFAAKYRYVGIKLMFAPQRARNEQLDKNVKEMCDFRIIFKASEKEIEYAFDDVTPGIRLIYPGDAAVRISNNPVIKVKTPGLGKNNDEVFAVLEGLAKMWSKIDVELPEFKYLNKLRKLREEPVPGKRFKLETKHQVYEDDSEEYVAGNRVIVKAGAGVVTGAAEAETSKSVQQESVIDFDALFDEEPTEEEIQLQQEYEEHIEQLKQKEVEREKELDVDDMFEAIAKAQERQAMMREQQAELEENIEVSTEAEEIVDSDEELDEEFIYNDNTEEIETVDSSDEYVEEDEEYVDSDEFIEEIDGHKYVDETEDIQSTQQRFINQEKLEITKPRIYDSRIFRDPDVKIVPTEKIKMENGKPYVMSCREFILKYGGEVTREFLSEYYDEEEIQEAMYKGEIIYHKQKDTFLTIP